jgi:hypothetical protein
MFLENILERRERPNMGMGCRIFLLDDNESLERLSVARLERLVLHREPEERLPQYAGKRMRCAMVLLEVAGRKPLRIIHTDYLLLPFDAEGRIDSNEWKRGSRLAMDGVTFERRERYVKIIHARHLFARRRYDHEFRWKPSRKIEKAIEDAIFGPTRKPL